MVGIPSTDVHTIQVVWQWSRDEWVIHAVKISEGTKKTRKQEVVFFNERLNPGKKKVGDNDTVTSLYSNKCM